MKYTTQPPALSRPSRIGSESCSRHDSCEQVAWDPQRCPVGTPLSELFFSVYYCGCGRQYIPTLGIFKNAAEAKYRLGHERGKLGYRGRQAILERDDHTCQGCGADGVALEVHHIIPFADWGTHEDDNLISLCRVCHGTRPE